MEKKCTLQIVSDLTSRTAGVNPDAEALVYGAPRVERDVPGHLWKGLIGESLIGQAKAVIRLPNADHWNGKLMIGGIPAVRNEYALDLILGDIALQRGYAVATCDKATPGLVLRNPARSMGEWETSYQALTEEACRMVSEQYGVKPTRTYIAGLSNGGYVTRIMMERHPELYDGAVEWEGVLWHPSTRHLLTTLPVYVKDYPIYCNWRGDRTTRERDAALHRLIDAGLPSASMPFWDVYFMIYWVLSLWLYGRSLDPSWEPFAAEWTNDWLRDPSPIADYPWQERLDVLAMKIAPIANSGKLTKPMLSLAGNWDCLVPFQHNALAYADLVEKQGASAHHRMYEIAGGNHVDGMLRSGLHGQQPVQPYFEAALYSLEDWVERGITPPASGRFEQIYAFTDRADELLSMMAKEV
jgi:pimeloyl-ACP methyl ester carboxylesterase